MLYKFIFCVLFNGCLGHSIIDNESSTNYIHKVTNEIPNNNNGIENAECPNLTPELIAEIQSYQPTVNRIVSAVVNGKYSGDTWNALAAMTDKFGARMTGSQSLEDAIDYMVGQMKDAGLANVHTENATVPHWERGYENCQMIAPRRAKINICGFGFSVGTLHGGLFSDLIAVESFDEFDGLAEADVRGKIVLFVPKWDGYGKTVIYRSKAASVASKKGAVAALVRSITPYSIGSLHTGMQRYTSDVTNKIPAAAVTVEDAYMLLRMYRRGEKITLHLEMEDPNVGDFVSRNTIAELAGEKETSVTVVSGHLDSWDIGVGAMDDGGGAFIAWKALHLLKRINVTPPKRTIRAILWTGEEQGIVGAAEYERQHKGREEEEFNFFMESDMGTFEPIGLDFSGNKDSECIFREILKLMTPLNATGFNTPIDAGPDIERWTNRGFPSASLMTKNEKYFYYHHSAGDSMLVENSDDLDKNTALFAAAAYVISDLSIDMPRDEIKKV